MSKFRLETSEEKLRELEYVKFQFIYTFEPLYLFFFYITNFNVYISKIHTN